MHTLLYGAHMSIAGGIDKAITAGESIGCTTIQLFTKSNRQWASKKLSPEDIALFKDTLAKSSIKVIVSHTAYLINIGSPVKDIESKSMQSLILELDRCNELSIPYLVLHPGSYLNTDPQSCLDRITDNLNALFKKHQGTTMILLELMSGQGSTVCSTFEQLAYILNNIEDKNRLGFCFDTCHAWASGYDFSTPKTYEQMWTHLDDILSIENLKVIHMNDSKNKRGSKVDRHEMIGKGLIGLTAFELLMNDERLFDIPKILETPKTSLLDDAYNMSILKGLIRPYALKKLGIKD